MIKAVAYTSSDGYSGILSGAPRENESDEDFAARLIALSLPAGATDVRVIDAADYVAPTPAPAKPTPREWLERLASSTQQAISAAALANPSILLWLLKASGTTAIDVTLNETIAGVGALVTAGVLTADDQTTLLTP